VVLAGFFGVRAERGRRPNQVVKKVYVQMQQGSFLAIFADAAGPAFHPTVISCPGNGGLRGSR
jgi:hypothetical protein